MNSRRMIKISNLIGFASVLALIYWIIIFITLEVFELRVFKEHTTSIFLYSILGILALMFGAFMINIMFNLSRIAERDKNEEQSNKWKKGIIVFLASIPCIIGLLFIGNFISAKQVENELKKSADEIIKSYSQEIHKISDYSFTREWINETANMVEIMERIDQNFDSVFLIVADEINGNKMYLTFSGRTVDEETQINKINYINKSTLGEREYLDKAIGENNNDKYFIFKYGSYKLFIPFESGNKRIVFIFSNRRSYGTFIS